MEDKIEKVKFKCSIKNCRKGVFYKMIIINKEKTLGDFLCLETEEIESEKENNNIKFDELGDIEYNFNKRQIINIQIITKEFKNFEYNYNSYQRVTCIASLINSYNSIYERKIKDDEDSEIMSIEVEKENNYNDSNRTNILEYFKKGSKLKFQFLFDFSYKNGDDDEFLKSINIFNNLMLYCYNNYHLYTTEDEVFMYGTGAKLKNEKFENDYFNINSGDNINMIKTYKKAKECFIDCLNKIIKGKKIEIFPFVKNVIDNIKNDKNKYNIIFIGLRNSLNEDDLNKIFELIDKNEELPFSLIFVYIKNEENIFFQKYSNVISVELGENNNYFDNKILYCFQQIGNNISKLNKFKGKITKETIKSTNLYEGDNDNDNSEEKEEENSYDKNNQSNKKENNKDEKLSKKYSLKDSTNEFTYKGENENKNNIHNPYSDDKKNSNNNILNSNLRTDSDSYNNNINNNAQGLNSI